MSYESFENYQYDSCISRGICSISPKISALQTVLVLYLRLFAKYALDLEVDNNIREFILNTISITIYNPEFNDNSFIFAIEQFRTILPKIICRKESNSFDFSGNYFQLYYTTHPV